MRKKAITVVALLVLIATAIFYKEVARAISTAGSFWHHSGQNDCISWARQDLTDEATSTVTTHCVIVDACQATVDTQGGPTPPDLIVCNVPDQTVAADRGTVDVRADLIGGTASATTTVNILVTGQGAQ